MKIGVIIYIADSEKMKDNFDVEKAIKALDLKADKVEVVS